MRTNYDVKRQPPDREPARRRCDIKPPDDKFGSSINLAENY
jgi:hypothetical protein